MMGGDITVESSARRGIDVQCPDAGGCQRADRRRGAAAGDGSRPTQTAAPRSERTVLVIDDDPVVHDLMARLLAKEGLRVVVASSGEEGLALARSVRPAAITLDVMMPGMDGWAVLARSRPTPTWPTSRSSMVTILDDRNMGYALGASDYLTKPIEPARLTRRAEEVHVDRASARRCWSWTTMPTCATLHRTAADEGWLRRSPRRRTGASALRAARAAARRRSSCSI